MHDLKFSNDIISAVKKELSKTGVKGKAGIITVNVRLGALGHVKPEGLRQTFDQIAKEEGLKNIKLVIQPLELEIRCRDCGFVSKHSKPVLSCPKCDGGNFDIDNMKEFLIESIVL